MLCSLSLNLRSRGLINSLYHCTLPLVIWALNHYFIFLFFLFIHFPHSCSSGYSPLFIGDHSNMFEVDPFIMFVFVLRVFFFCMQVFKFMKMVLCHGSYSASCFFLNPKLCFRRLSMLLYIYVAYCF